MNNEPVAWMETYKGEPNNLDWDKSNLNYGSEFHDVIPLYTHPAKELNDGGEPVKNATYWKRQYNLMATQNDNLKSGLYHANEQIKYLESHPVKELTVGGIFNIWASENGLEDMDMYKFDDFLTTFRFVEKVILRKAQEK